MRGSLFDTANLLYLIVIVIGAVLTFLFTPITKLIAQKTGAIDVPDSNRKFHSAPTPRLGGIAIMTGFVVAAVCFDLIFTGKMSERILATVLGGMVICGVGILDDIYDLSAISKLLVQIAVSLCAVLLGGSIEFITVFGKTVYFGVMSVPITVCWMVLIINALNLLDGLDGLACGVALLSSVTLLLISILMGDPVCAVIAAALCGASLGFLPYNANPAAVFMGDCGSTFFGYIFACISVFGLFKGVTVISAVAPVLVFALPMVDVVSAACMRISRKESPFKPDRSHLHYKLIDTGFTPKQSVAIIYIASAIFCGCAIVSLYYKLAAIIVAVCTMIFLFLLKHADKFLPEEYGELKENAARAEARSDDEETPSADGEEEQKTE